MESSKFKLNKTKFIQISLLLLAFFLIFFTYFFNLKKKQPSTNLDQIKTIEPDGEKEKVFYGWFDNHLAYISSTIKFLNDNGKDGKKFWNEADIYHFIGKDIVYHHFLFLPAMRLGIDEEYKLPDYIPTRGHLTLESKKISKSRNWYIGLKDFLKIFPSDYLRFYLVSINPYSQDDLNFNWDEFATKINSELIGNLGNLVNRGLGFTVKSFNSIVPDPE